MPEERDTRLNPNTASAKALEELPGIGPAIAQRLIAARPFESLEDILRVQGLGRMALERLTPLLTLDAGEIGEVAEEIEAVRTIEEGLAEAHGSEIGEREEQVDEVVEEAPEMEAEGVPQPGDQDLEAPEPEPERELVEEKLVEERTYFSRSESLWLVFGAGALTLILSVVLSLVVIAGINQTLDFAQHSAVQGMQTELGALQNELEGISSEVGSLSSRLEALQGLSGRMSTVEDQVGMLQGEVEGAVEAVSAIQEQLDQISQETRTLAERTQRFETFLEGLSQLLGRIVSPETQPQP
jgi:competence ComEA-like helix-hairpin-helix protein